MAKREAVGVCKCPECGFAHAEVREQKNGLLYRWCPDCSAQYFTKNNREASERLRKSMSPFSVSDTEPAPVSDTEPAPAPAPVSEPAPAPAPVSETPRKNRGFDLGAL